MKSLIAVGAVLVGLLILSAIVWFCGSSNPETPAGYVGYLTRGAVFSKTEFYGLQTGPTSPGRAWMLRVVNVSVTPYTYTEGFNNGEAVLSKDNMKVGFNIHIVYTVRPDKVKEFVEKYSTLYEGEHPEKVVQVAYDNFLKEPLRTFARDEVQQLNGLEIKDNITPVGNRILVRVKQLTDGTPFEVRSIVVGNISYPDVVANAVADKMATTQILEKKKTEIAIAEQEKQKRIVEAEGIAKAMAIINEKLTINYLQHEAIEAQKAMVNSPNHTTIYIPVGPMGVPVVQTIDPYRSDQPKK